MPENSRPQYKYTKKSFEEARRLALARWKTAMRRRCSQEYFIPPVHDEICGWSEAVSGPEKVEGFIFGKNSTMIIKVHHCDICPLKLSTGQKCGDNKLFGPSKDRAWAIDFIAIIEDLDEYDESKGSE